MLLETLQVLLGRCDANMARKIWWILETCTTIKSAYVVQYRGKSFDKILTLSRNWHRKLSRVISCKKKNQPKTSMWILFNEAGSFRAHYNRMGAVNFRVSTACFNRDFCTSFLKTNLEITQYSEKMCSTVSVLCETVSLMLWKKK